MAEKPDQLKCHMQLYSSFGFSNFQNANVAPEKSLEFALGFVPDVTG